MEDLNRYLKARVLSYQQLVRKNFIRAEKGFSLTAFSDTSNAHRQSSNGARSSPLCL